MSYVGAGEDTEGGAHTAGTGMLGQRKEVLEW